MDQAKINTILIIIAGVIFLIILLLIVFRTKIIENLIKKIFARPDRDMLGMLKRKEKHLDDCIKEGEKLIGIMKMYQAGERITGTGSYYLNLGVEPDEVTYSDNFAQIFDVVKRQKVTIETIMSIIHIDDVGRVRSEFKKAIDTGLPYVMEYRVGKRNRGSDLIRVWGEPIKNSLGVVGVCGAIIILKSNVA